MKLDGKKTKEGLSCLHQCLCIPTYALISFKVFKCDTEQEDSPNDAPKPFPLLNMPNRAVKTSPELFLSKGGGFGN
jgi:hypothetical protein